MKRKIIRIDEEKCNGCGECVPNCAEGALQIIHGKAKLVGDALCDGLGACLGECPMGALTIEEREAEEFSEDKVKEHLWPLQAYLSQSHQGCPGMMAREFTRHPQSVPNVTGNQPSALGQWPIQLRLLNPRAPYFKNAELLVAADCVPFSYANFHNRFLQGKIVIVFCPKLDNAHDEYLEKLTEILKANDIKSITIVHMEVPCCTGTVRLVEEALKNSGTHIVVKEYTISLHGEII
ncbi:MAG: 4Fe-4S binding protein [Candidatus Omnitrophica bacterium]|nr:4Fe-4S binding protein [Candidatus Omnitrophota bacterium]